MKSPVPTIRLSYDPICRYGNSYTIRDFIGPLFRSPVATDRMIGLSLIADGGLKGISFLTTPSPSPRAQEVEEILVFKKEGQKLNIYIYFFCFKTSGRFYAVFRRWVLQVTISGTGCANYRQNPCSPVAFRGFFDVRHESCVVTSPEENLRINETVGTGIREAETLHGVSCSYCGRRLNKCNLRSSWFQYTLPQLHFLSCTYEKRTMFRQGLRLWHNELRQGLEEG